MSRSPSSPLLLTLALAGMVWPAAAPAQVDDFRTGTHVLRRLLHERKFKALTEWKQVVEDPERTLLILFGKPTDNQDRWRWQVPDGLVAFVQRGGAVLLATDHNVRNAEVGRVFGYYPMAERVSAWQPGTDGADAIADRFIYRGRAAGLRECVIVEPTEVKDPPLFQGNQFDVVTNRPGTLWPAKIDVPGVRILAQFPPGCWYNQDKERPHRTLFPRPFAVSREVGKSRLLMLSDHSVFINEMLLQETNGKPDNNNLDFTYDALEWLRDQRRDRVLIIEDGEIQSELAVPLRADPDAFKKLLRRLTPGLNKVVLDEQARHQQDHHLDELTIKGINQATGRFPFGRAGEQNYYLLLIVLASGGLLVFGLSRLVRASHRGSVGPVFADFGNRAESKTSSLALRATSALAGDDLRDYAREAVRDWFGDIPGCPADLRGAKPPHVESRGLGREVRWLWRLASGAPASRMSQREFIRLLARLDVLRKAIDAGELRIEW